MATGNERHHNPHDDEEADDQDKEIGVLSEIKKKILAVYQKCLIHPTNRRLQYFHMVVAISLFYDTFLTGVIISNYDFMYGKNDNFMN